MADAMVFGLRTMENHGTPWTTDSKVKVHEWRPPEPAYKLCTNMFSEMFNSLSLTNADHVVFNTVQSTFLQIIAQICRWIDGPFQMQLGSTATHFIGSFYPDFLLLALLS